MHNYINMKWTYIVIYINIYRPTMTDMVMDIYDRGISFLLILLLFVFLLLCVCGGGIN